MKLRYLQLLILAALLAFPVHAQVKLDSAEVARILQGAPEKIVPPRKNYRPTTTKRANPLSFLSKTTAIYRGKRTLKRI